MASFRTCVPGPMFNTNFPRNNINMNLRPERPPMPPFQRAPNPSFQRVPNPSFQRVPNPSFPPFQPAPQQFTPRTFQERPRFSHFPNSFGFQGFRNRSPAPETVSPMNMRYPNQSPRFENRFERPFRSWNQRPPFMAPRQPFQNRPRAPVHPYSHQDFSSQGNSNKKQKTKVARKLKDDNAEKPFSCDTCDRAFMTETELNYHFSEHVKCGMVNCMFEAHPKIVALHRKMQHETGYADAINKLQDHAEIQKWREERRNRFPTAVNIQKRKAEQAEKEARGEVLETKEFGKFKRQRGDDWELRRNNRGRRRRGRWNNRYDRRYSNFQNRQVNYPVTDNNNSESDSDGDSHISLTMFSGLTYFAKPLPFENEHNPDSQREQQEISKESGKEVSTCNSSKNESSDFDVYSNIISSDKTSVVINDENVKDKIKEIASDSVLKTPVNGSESVTENHPDIINIADDMNVVADDSVLEASINDSEKCTEVIDIADSDDEGPSVLPIVKRQNEDSDDEPVIISRYSSVEELPTGDVVESDSISVGKKDDKNVPLNDISNITTSTNNEKCSDDAPLNDGSNVSGSNNDEQSTNGNRHNRHQRNQFQENPFERKDKAFVAKKSTLLEKLLADDIRHERNVILQCVRHIVNNKFFGVGN